MFLPAPLERYSPRALNLIGSLLADQDASVVLSRRSEAAAVAVLENRTVVLDPDRTDLYDLALCARLLQKRDRFEGKAAQQQERRPRRPPAAWLKEAHATLLRDFPGIHRLPGQFRPPARTDGLEVVWQSVRWKTLGTLSEQEQLHLQGFPGVQIVGAQEDFVWLARAVRAGAVPTEHLPGLEGLPVMTLPLTLALTDRHTGKIEALERAIELGRTEIQTLMSCYRRKSENLDERLPLARHTLSGVNLDSNRLVEAMLARRTGTNPRLFRRREANFEPIFDPAQHLVVLGLDLNCLHPGSLLDLGISHRFLGWKIEAYRLLGVDFVVLGFADHLLKMASGRLVYAHIPVLLKDVDEPFDGSFWSRLAHVMERPPRLPGAPACYHPLLMRSIGRLMDRVARDWNHSYRSIAFGTFRGMPRERKEFWTAAFLTRTAALLDQEIEGIRQRFRGTLDTTGSFVPKELIAHARRDGVVAKMVPIPF